jgi:DNA-binding IclR family transcriptional regulator
LVKSASRVIDILELLAQHPQGLSHGEIAAGLSLPKSSLTAILRTLIDRGYLEHDRRTGTYALGVALVTLSGIYLRRTDISQIAQPVLASLMLETRESAALTIRQGREVVVIGKQTCDRAILHSLQLGDRGPVHASASGKAMIAMLPKAELNALLGPGPLPAITGNTITDIASLRVELDGIADGAVGYSREEMVEGIVAMGLPVFDATGAAVAGISVGVPVSRFSAATAATVERHLRHAATAISNRLGWSGSAGTAAPLKRQA